jgi:nucleoside-diphosphate-sugar epimerase
MKKIAITGASGFVGSNLAHYLMAKGYQVAGYGRRANPFEKAKIEYLQWDITREPHQNEIGFEAVIHCAGSVTDWGKYQDLYAVNVEGTKRVLAAFPNAKLFIHISTASVYDPKKPKHFVKESEPYPARYLNAYAATKMLAEKIVQESTHPNRVIVRPHIIYGNGDTTVLPRLMKARRFGKFLVIGNGKNNLSLTYIENFCRAIELMLDKHFGFEIFNISDAKTDTVNNILAEFRKNFGITEEVLYLNKKIAVGAGTALEKIYQLLNLAKPPLITPYIVAQMAQEYTLDISKAQTRLGYEPLFTYPEGFSKIKLH